MRLLRKIAYGEFSEFVQEKKVHIGNVRSTTQQKTLDNIVFTPFITTPT